MSGAHSISAVVPTKLQHLVITVEHPDGRVSHIPVVQHNKDLVARVPVGTTIVDIALPRTA